MEFAIRTGGVKITAVDASVEVLIAGNFLDEVLLDCAENEREREKEEKSSGHGGI